MVDRLNIKSRQFNQWSTSHPTLSARRSTDQNKKQSARLQDRPRTRQEKRSSGLPSNPRRSNFSRRSRKLKPRPQKKETTEPRENLRSRQSSRQSQRLIQQKETPEPRENLRSRQSSRQSQRLLQQKERTTTSRNEILKKTSPLKNDARPRTNDDLRIMPYGSRPTQEKKYIRRISTSHGQERLRPCYSRDDVSEGVLAVGMKSGRYKGRRSSRDTKGEDVPTPVQNQVISSRPHTSSGINLADYKFGTFSNFTIKDGKKSRAKSATLTRFCKRQSPTSPGSEDDKNRPPSRQSEKPYNLFPQRPPAEVFKDLDQQQDSFEISRPLAHKERPTTSASLQWSLNRPFSSSGRYQSNY